MQDGRKKIKVNTVGLISAFALLVLRPLTDVDIKQILLKVGTGRAASAFGIADLSKVEPQPLTKVEI